MTDKNVWICAFGSNLFNQLDPDDISNPTKKIVNPRIIKRIPENVTSVDILHVSDSQSLVHFTASNKDDSSSRYLEVWGFDEGVNSIINERFQIDPPQNDSCISHPINQVKLWVGRTKILGYLATDGTINPFNLRGQDSIHSPRRAAMRQDRTRYQAITMSDNGQVLVAASHNTIAQAEGVHRLELWSSFEELVYGIETDSNPKSFELADSSYGQTEVQLASGASHFLILTHTPGSSKSLDENNHYHSTLYAFGDNRFGQLGIGSRSVSADEPQVIEDLTDILKIECGLFHSVVIGKDGELFTFGHNRKGQCGVGEQVVDLTSPLLIDLGGNGESGHVIDVIDARCGSEHTVLITSSGIWVAGSNALGQLGLKSPDSQLEFQLNEAISTSLNLTNKPFTWKIQAGRWNTFIWSNK